MNSITRKCQLRLEVIKTHMSDIKLCLSFHNEDQRKDYLDRLRHAGVEESVWLEIQKIITPCLGADNRPVSRSDRWNHIYDIMNEHGRHGLINPTWEFLLDKGDDQLKKHLKETNTKKELIMFDQLFKNKKLGTLPADRREIIASELLDWLEFKANEVQKEYDKEVDEKFPIYLDSMISYFSQIEKNMQHLLGDESVSYDANLMKKNNPLTVIGKLSAIIERLSSDLAAYDKSKEFNNAREELANMTDRFSQLKEENQNLKKDKENLKVELEEKTNELEDEKTKSEETQKEFEEKKMKFEETQNKRDAQFEEIKAFMYKQAEDNKALCSKYWGNYSKEDIDNES